MAFNATQVSYYAEITSGFILFMIFISYLYHILYHVFMVDDTYYYGGGDDDYVISEVRFILFYLLFYHFILSYFNVVYLNSTMQLNQGEKS